MLCKDCMLILEVFAKNELIFLFVYENYFLSIKSILDNKLGYAFNEENTK